VKTCKKCTADSDRNNKRNNGKKRAEKENADPSTPRSEDQEASYDVEEVEPPKRVHEGRMPEMPMSDVLKLVGENKQSPFELDCLAILDDDTMGEDFDGDEQPSLTARAHAIARRVREASQYAPRTA